MTQDESLKIRTGLYIKGINKHNLKIVNGETLTCKYLHLHFKKTWAVLYKQSKCDDSFI